jgi:hypothetical protein
VQHEDRVIQAYLGDPIHVEPRSKRLNPQVGKPA